MYINYVTHHLVSSDHHRRCHIPTCVTTFVIFLVTVRCFTYCELLSYVCNKYWKLWNTSLVTYYLISKECHFVSSFMWVCARDCTSIFVQHLVLSEHYHDTVYVFRKGGSCFSFFNSKFVTPWSSVGSDSDIGPAVHEIPRFVINKH